MIFGKSILFKALVYKTDDVKTGKFCQGVWRQNCVGIELRPTCEARGGAGRRQWSDYSPEYVHLQESLT